MTLSESTIHEHYRHVKPVYEALATVSDYPTIGLNDFVGWYIKRDHDDVETIKAGYPQRGRIARLDRDYDEIHDPLCRHHLQDIDRLPAVGTLSLRRGRRYDRLAG
jgi:putative DNA primase/helicase